MPNNNNNRGRFLLGRTGSSVRRSQNKSNTAPPNSVRNTTVGRSGPQMKPLKENITSSMPHPSLSTRQNPREQPQRHQTQKNVSFQNHRSSTPIANDENVDATGFSKAELHDLEESFKLFDIYGEGSVQVGDLRGILEVLQQEQQQQQQQQQQSVGSKYPNLKTILHRLSEISDEDNLTMHDYIQLMASTTISNAIMVENGNNVEESGSNTNLEHFARVFQLFDTDDKGYITLNDLEKIAIELGEHDMTRGELQEMIDRALGGTSNKNHNDAGNGEKKVNIDEFTRMMTMSLFPSNGAGFS